MVAGRSNSGGLPTRGRRLTPQSVAQGIDTLCERDADLRGIVERNGRPGVRLRKPGFTTLASIIVEQQVSLASGRAIWQRLDAGVDGVNPENIASRSIDELRTMGLSRQKATYIHGIAEAVVDGTLDFRRIHRSGEDQVREQLMSLRGVGRWTADIYLLTAMGRPDIWPRGDLALDTALAWVKGLDDLPSKDALDILTRSWSPWRSVAARILWHGYVNEIKA